MKAPHHKARTARDLCLIRGAAGEGAIPIASWRKAPMLSQSRPTNLYHIREDIRLEGLMEAADPVFGVISGYPKREDDRDCRR